MGDGTKVSPWDILKEIGRGAGSVAKAPLKAAAWAVTPVGQWAYGDNGLSATKEKIRQERFQLQMEALERQRKEIEAEIAARRGPPARSNKQGISSQDLIELETEQTRRRMASRGPVYGPPAPPVRVRGGQYPRRDTPPPPGVGVAYTPDMGIGTTPPPPYSTPPSGDPLRKESLHFLKKTLGEMGIEMPSSPDDQRSLLRLMLNKDVARARRKGRGKARREEETADSPFDALRRGVNEKFSGVKAGKVYSDDDTVKRGKRRISSQMRGRAFYDPVSGDLIERPPTMRKDQFEALRQSRMGAATQLGREKADALSRIDHEEAAVKHASPFLGFNLTGVPAVDQMINSAVGRMREEKETAERAKALNEGLGLGLSKIGSLRPEDMMAMSQENRLQQGHQVNMLQALMEQSQDSTQRQGTQQFMQRLLQDPNTHPYLRNIAETVGMGGSPGILPLVTNLQMGLDAANRQQSQFDAQQSLAKQKLEIDQQTAGQDFFKEGLGKQEKMGNDADALAQEAYAIPGVPAGMAGGLSGAGITADDKTGKEYARFASEFPAKVHASLRGYAGALSRAVQNGTVTAQQAEEIGTEIWSMAGRVQAASDRLNEYLPLGENDESLSSRPDYPKDKSEQEQYLQKYRKKLHPDTLKEMHDALDEVRRELPAFALQMRLMGIS